MNENKNVVLSDRELLEQVNEKLDMLCTAVQQVQTGIAVALDNPSVKSMARTFGVELPDM